MIPVGGMFFSAFLQVFFDRVVPREFWSEIWNFFRESKLDELLSDLDMTMLVVEKFIYDAESKQFSDPRVKRWLDILRAAFYDAEDILDAITTELMQRELEEEEESSSQFQTWKLQNYVLSSIQALDRGMETKLKEILERLKKLVELQLVLGLTEGVPKNPSSDRLPTTSLLDTADLYYGRDVDKKIILESLLSDNAGGNNLDVISIMGMGGLGKTTLAQLVYNDDTVEQHFDCKAWICISEDFDVIKLTRNILEAFNLHISGISNSLDLLQVELKKKLKDKKFLLVLDDVWNENPNDWEMLRKPLLHGAKGSKILVTTRNERVTAIMQTILTHHLPQLCGEDCWLVFAKHAFENGELHADPKLKATGRKIVEKCKGLPLAAKVLGSLLRYMPTPEEWDEVLERNLWELADIESDIITVLRVSYQYLPYHLKRCFAYFSIFPKDYEFSKEQLVRLWMAQGFLVHPKRREKMEKLGNEYFNELVSRSFFQNSGGGKKLFVMHDLINDMARFVSGESCVFMDGGSTQEVQVSTRHLSYTYMTPEELSSFPATNCLRTFLMRQQRYGYDCPPVEVPQNLLQTLRLLRVFSLRGFPIFELPESIGSLKHLRYLDLSNTKIKMLPDSICNLYNLQTLLLVGCYGLIKLPENMYKLVNLLYLETDRCGLSEEMPINIGRLKKLKKLSFFNVGKQRGATIRELGQLSELGGYLRICQLENVISPIDAFEARLKNKKYLKELNLVWSGKHDDLCDEVLEKLQPHKNLEKLCIQSFGGRSFPTWIGDKKYSNMVSIKLYSCKNCDSLPTLGQLPSLKYLFIRRFDGLVRVGAEFYGNNGICAVTPFPSLYELSFQHMSQWEKWRRCEVENAFPCLQQLSITDCPKLKGDLTTHLPSLTKLDICRCPELGGSLPKAPILAELDIRYCEDMESVLEKVLLDSTCLQSLSITGCSSLTSLPEINSTCPLKSLEITGCSSLRSLPEINSSCPLERLIVSECSSLMCLPQKIGLLSSLISLKIRECEKLELPMEYQFASLERLLISSSCCDTLRSFPLNLFPKLGRLAISDCKNLESFSFPDALPPEGFVSLTYLYIANCPNLLSFSAQGLPFPNLLQMKIEDCNSLKLLGGRHVQALSSPHHHLSVFPSTLNSLYMSNCNNFVMELLDLNLISRLNSLSELTIKGSCEGVKSFPLVDCLPTSLAYLTIEGFSDLETLQHKGLHNLSSLSRLKINNCEKLQSLSQEGLPASLSHLFITDCPQLVHRLQRDQGWDKIASIPNVYIDNKRV